MGQVEYLYYEVVMNLKQMNRGLKKDMYRKTEKRLEW